MNNEEDKKTTTMVLDVDATINKGFKKYCSDNDIRRPRDLAVKILERELAKLIKKG